MLTTQFEEKMFAILFFLLILLVKSKASEEESESLLQSFRNEHGQNGRQSKFFFIDFRDWRSDRDEISTEKSRSLGIVVRFLTLPVPF